MNGQRLIKMSKLSSFSVDTFTGPNLLGNPALICLADAPLQDDVMRQISINSVNKATAIAFIWPEREVWRIRSFSNSGEIKFCGHASLAACAVIFSHLKNGATEIKLCTSLLDIMARFSGDRASMSIPAFSYQQVPISISPFSSLQGQKVEDLYYGNETFFMRLSSKEDVLNFKPDLRYLKTQKLYLVVTAHGETCDFVSRFFGPASGQDEDPVTGSAHCVLAQIWADILGKRSFIARQLSTRGGQLEIELGEDRSSLMMSGKVSIRKNIMLDL